MPIFQKSELNETRGGIPFNQVENLSPKPVVASKPEKGIVDKIVEVGAAASLEHNWFSQAINEESNPYKGQKPTAAYNPYEDEQLKGYDGPLDWFVSSASKEDTSWRLQQYSRKQERQKTLQEAGAWGTVAEVAAGLFTPDILIGGGIVTKGIKAGQYAKAAIVGAETGAISGGLYGMGQNQIDSSRTTIDVVKDAGAFAVAGAVLGPVLHGAGQIIGGGKKAKTNIPPVIDEHVPGPTDMDAAALSAKQYVQHTMADVPVDMEAQAARLTSDIEAQRIYSGIKGTESMNDLIGIYHSMPASAEQESVFQLLIAGAKKDPSMVGKTDHEVVTAVTNVVNSMSRTPKAARAIPTPEELVTGHVPPKASVPYTAPTVANTDLVGSFGANKLNLNQAGVTLANSSFTEFKIASQKLFHDLRMRIGNTDGSWTNLQSVESELGRLIDGGMAKSGSDFSNAFKEYIKSGWETPRTLQYVQQKYGKTKLTMSEFADEVSHAGRNGDRHAIAEIERHVGTLRNVTEELAVIAEKLGRLDRSGDLKGTAESYWRRIFNKDAMKAKPTAFKQILANGFRHTNPTWTRQQLDDAAQKTFDTIIHGSSDRMVDFKRIHIDTNGDTIFLGNGSKSSVSMERVLEIADNDLEEFLINDSREIIRRYMHTLGTDIALTKMIGDTTGEGIIARALAEKNAKLAAVEANTALTAAQKEAANLKIDAEFIKGQKAIQNSINIIRGEYKVDPTLPEAWGKTANAVAQYNYITMLGSAAVASIGDLSKPALYFGLGKSIKYAMPAIRQGLGDIFRLPSVKDPAYDAMVQANKRIGIGMEIVLQTRHVQMNDIVQKYTGKNPVLRGLEYAADKMGIWNGLAHLTDFQKQLVGVMGNDALIRNSIAEATGTATERQLRDLRVWGIDQGMSRRIADEFNVGVTAGHNRIDRGFHTTDTLKWDDREAAETVERALKNIADVVIYSPSVGAKVVTGIGDAATERLLTQFQSFNFGSHMQHFTQHMQQIHERDASAMGYFVASIMIGMAVIEIQDSIKRVGFEGEKGERKERTWKEYGYDVISASSLAPIAFMINNVTSGTGFGDMRRLISDDDRPTLSASNFNGGSILGPTGGQLKNLHTVISSIQNDTEDAKTISAARRLMPFNNLVWFRNLINYGEERAQDAFDLPDRATSTFTIRK